eukprot:TRINITY_DN7569_c0_g1_i1.p1 TRINITY_DN7569_c0_g1~~TRINITY_DN7569_c0_g1_i1.p1  ORF type:complete len:172 (-),score=33.72 TRINITY_DN7569_c0_g1_i1:232-747(-)
MALLQPLRRSLFSSTRTIRTQTSRFSNAFNEFDLLQWSGSKTRIEAYNQEGFVVNGTYLKGPVFLLPKNHLFWAPIDAASIQPDHFSLLEAFHPQMELLIIGVGEETPYLEPKIHEHLKKLKIPYETMTVRNAVSTFNVLNQEDRLVAAAIIPVKVSKEYIQDLTRPQLSK